MFADHTTLVEFLIEERRRHPSASGDLNGLILDVALACKAIANRVALGALGGVLGSADHTNVQGEVQQKLDVISNEHFLRATEWGGHVAGMVSGELEQPYRLPAQYPRGKYLLAFDPLDGSSNIDVNLSVGSIFSILRAPNPGTDPKPEDYLQPGCKQVCAGYAIYGPSTMLVLSVGTGVHAFTLDRALGEFILTRASIQIPRPPKNSRSTPPTSDSGSRRYSATSPSAWRAAPGRVARTSRCTGSPHSWSRLTGSSPGEECFSTRGTRKTPRKRGSCGCSTRRTRCPSDQGVGDLAFPAKSSADSSVNVTSVGWSRRWLGDSTAARPRQAATTFGVTSANTSTCSPTARTASSFAISVSIVFKLTLPTSERIDDGADGSPASSSPPAAIRASI